MLCTWYGTACCGTQVLLEAGDGLVTIPGLSTLTADTVSSTSEGDDGVHITIDEGKIRSTGITAVRDFLLKLQVYRVRALYPLPAYSAPHVWVMMCVHWRCH